MREEQGLNSLSMFTVRAEKNEENTHTNGISLDEKRTWRIICTKASSFKFDCIENELSIHTSMISCIDIKKRLMWQKCEICLFSRNDNFTKYATRHIVVVVKKPCMCMC